MLWGLPSTRRQITFETAGLADLIGWRPSQCLAEEHNPKRYIPRAPFDVFRYEGKFRREEGAIGRLRGTLWRGGERLQITSKAFNRGRVDRKTQQRFPPDKTMFPPHQASGARTRIGARIRVWVGSWLAIVSSVDAAWELRSKEAPAVPRPPLASLVQDGGFRAAL